MKLLRVLLCLAVAGVAAAAHAARTEPIVNYDSVPVPKQVTIDDVRDAIVSAAKLRQWTISERPNNVMHAAYSVKRGKHVAVVEIRYTATSYSIRYLDSVNLNYGEESGKPMIHKVYNTWVGDLRSTIDLQFKMQ